MRSGSVNFDLLCGRLFLQGFIFGMTRKSHSRKKVFKCSILFSNDIKFLNKFPKNH